ncbi:MAG TPA: DUF4142 domain-containing protein [Alphaproteobacteria bacterium]|nr:DUF4142 domain-containing protein [Alphaproteobacteria bacterium]
MKTYCVKKYSLLLPCLMMAVAQLAIVAAYADDSTDNRGQFSASDYKFAKEAARGGKFEVTLGNVAASNSRNASVQQFGQQMVKDHGRAGQKLQQIATSKNATLPDELSAKQQREVDRLSKLTGPEFDKAYVACMIKAHKADEKAFKKASEEADDPDLRNFAATTLTMVRDHLRMAQDLESSVKNEVSVNY